MNLGISKEEPRIMFIDLNSAFATAEQQAHRSLRGKPIGVTNRISKHCCVIACSYEAKALGVKVGMRLDEVQQFIPGFIMLESDPPKYNHIYQSLVRIMLDYSPNVTMKSIDEGVIDFHGMNEYHRGRSLVDIGYEIKERVHNEIGSYMNINVGIAPNRFLAKQASNWHKPNGLDVIDHRNLKSYYKQLKLTDLTGIASHFEARLNANGIFTPIEFLNASADTLRRLVFQSVIGEDWYQRLRGYEVDNVITKLGNVGRQFVMDVRTNDDAVILPRFQYLCETAGKKLRYNNVDARGVYVWASFQTGDHWYVRKMYKMPFFSDRDIYTKALYLFNQRPKHLNITALGVTLYKLDKSNRSQLGLFDDINKVERLTTALDDLNERYGNFVISAANSMEGKTKVKQKIPFGSTKYFELLLNRK